VSCLPYDLTYVCKLLQNSVASLNLNFYCLAATPNGPVRAAGV